MNALVPNTELEEADAAHLRHGVCEFLESISKELSKMAFDNGLDTLTVLFDMAREDAKRTRVGSDKGRGRARINGVEGHG